MAWFFLLRTVTTLFWTLITIIAPWLGCKGLIRVSGLFYMKVRFSLIWAFMWHTLTLTPLYTFQREKNGCLYCILHFVPFWILCPGRYFMTTFQDYTLSIKLPCSVYSHTVFWIVFRILSDNKRNVWLVSLNDELLHGYCAYLPQSN